MDGLVPQGDGAHTQFVYCCGAVTELLKFGSCLSGCRLLILIIPGESLRTSTQGHEDTLRQTSCRHQWMACEIAVWTSFKLHNDLDRVFLSLPLRL